MLFCMFLYWNLFFINTVHVILKNPLCPICRHNINTIIDLISYLKFEVLISAFWLKRYLFSPNNRLYCQCDLILLAVGLYVLIYQTLPMQLYIFHFIFLFHFIRRIYNINMLSRSINWVRYIMFHITDHTKYGNIYGSQVKQQHPLAWFTLQFIGPHFSLGEHSNDNELTKTMRTIGFCE